MVAHPSGKTNRGLCGIQAPTQTSGLMPSMKNRTPLQSLIALSLVPLAACWWHAMVHRRRHDHPPQKKSRRQPRAAARLSARGWWQPAECAKRRRCRARPAGVDERGSPPIAAGQHQLLTATVSRWPLRLPFNPDTFSKPVRIGLHGRANQAGRLILRLPAQPVTQAEAKPSASPLSPAP